MFHLIGLLYCLAGVIVALYYETKYRNQLSKNIDLWNEMMHEHQEKADLKSAYDRLLSSFKAHTMSKTTKHHAA